MGGRAPIFAICLGPVGGERSDLEAPNPRKGRPEERKEKLGRDRLGNEAGPFCAKHGRVLRCQMSLSAGLRVSPHVVHELHVVIFAVAAPGELQQRGEVGQEACGLLVTHADREVLARVEADEEELACAYPIFQLGQLEEPGVRRVFDADEGVAAECGGDDRDRQLGGAVAADLVVPDVVTAQVGEGANVRGRRLAVEAAPGLTRCAEVSVEVLAIGDLGDELGRDVVDGEVEPASLDILRVSGGEFPAGDGQREGSVGVTEELAEAGRRWGGPWRKRGGGSLLARGCPCSAMRKPWKRSCAGGMSSQPRITGKLSFEALPGRLIGSAGLASDATAWSQTCQS